MISGDVMDCYYPIHAMGTGGQNCKKERNHTPNIDLAGQRGKEGHGLA